MMRSWKSFCSDQEREFDAFAPEISHAANGPSIGGFYAFILGQNERVSLSVVGRSSYESMKANLG